jgi:signal peptidase II
MIAKADRSYRWLFWVLVVVGFAADQVSKYEVFSRLYNGGQGDYLALIGPAEESGRIFGLQTAFTRTRDPGTGLLGPLRTWGGEYQPYVNTGALWGRGENKNLLFLLISLTAAVAIGAWSMRPTASRDLGLCVALGLILAGTLGNLYDRVVFAGVRDFLQWSYLYLFPTFNLADSCLVCGAGLLLWQAICTRSAIQSDTRDETGQVSVVGVPDGANPACLNRQTAEGLSSSPACPR